MKNNYHCDGCSVSRIINTNLCPHCLDVDSSNSHSLMEIAEDLDSGVLTVDPRLSTAVYRSTIVWAKKKRCDKVIYTKKVAAYCARMNGEQDSFVEIKNILGDVLIRYNNSIAVFGDIR